MTDVVDYSSLDAAKKQFMNTCSETLKNASTYGSVSGRLGNSANVFALNLRPFIEAGQNEVFVTMLPEGLGTADDARPADLTASELKVFWYNIGLKTLSCLTNDAASSGMQTLLLGLYLPSATPETVFDENFTSGFLAGIKEGCKQVGCVYFCGETPQLKEKLFPNKLDVAGSLFGIMPPGVKPITGDALSEGNKIVFVQSSGPHENGFTTLRKMETELPQGYRTKLPSGQSFWQAINEPGILYTPLIQGLLHEKLFPTNIEPITGHGWQKLMRPKESFKYVIENTLEVPEIFSFIENTFKLSKQQMVEIFNYGAGLALFAKNRTEAEKMVSVSRNLGLKACVAGRVEQAAKASVKIIPWGITLDESDFTLK